MAKDWQRIRAARTDLTDYVIHFTKSQFNREKLEYVPQGAVFDRILRSGVLLPTFAPIKNKTAGTTRNTVRGPSPAVCFTEQPLSAVVSTLKVAGGRYSGFGIAYHKYALYSEGGRPVIYGTESMLGKLILPGEPGHEPGKEIYRDGLPPSLQYLFVRYEPTVDDWDDYPIDWTWEREWRIKPSPSGLPLYLSRQAGVFRTSAIGALIVEKDRNVEVARGILTELAEGGATWATKLTRIISLETVERKLGEGDLRYARIETWPEV